MTSPLPDRGPQGSKWGHWSQSAITVNEEQFYYEEELADRDGIVRSDGHR
jgi:hypothetical protein